MRDFVRRFPVERAAFLAAAQGSFAPYECERWLSSVLAQLMFLRFLRERPGPQARIPDEAIKRLFTFFDSYRWEIDESSVPAGDALTPEVLGRTFEKHADQKRSGTYYTAPDVTAYIARGTILPFLLDDAARRCPDSFGPNGLAGRLLHRDPDRYLPEAARKGVDLPLPPDVEAGVVDVTQRDGWDRPAPPDYALPTETWREHLARRRRCHNVRRLQGEFTTINDLLTNNLDLARFTADLLRQADAALLRVFWHTLRDLSVFDPACGCGEFLLASLRVLEPLFHACLGRMETFAEVADFRAALDEAGPPAARRVFVRRSILERNLHGVDLLPEAVEVCRLRLLLALVAVQGGAMEPALPALDNLRSGNSLVGSVTSDGPSDSWSVRSFDWPVEFPRVMRRGGFDVIVGNPPYLENNAVRKHYDVRGFLTASCGNVFALFWERCLDLARPAGRVGLIVPVAAICTDDYAPLRELLHVSGTSVVSSFNDRPSRLFRGLQHGRLCIILHEKGRQPGRTFSTGFNKWRAAERPYLFERLSFVETTGLGAGGAVAKVGTSLEVSLLRKVRAERGALRDHVVRAGGFPLYCTRKLSHFVQVLDFVPAITDEAGGERRPTELRVFHFATQQQRDVFLAVLNSNLFYWLLTVYSDCRNLNKRELEGAPFDLRRAKPRTLARLSTLSRALMKDIRRNARVLPMRYPGRGTLRIQCTYPRRSKPLIDAIDRALGPHYDLTDEEIDFLLHFDAKYRIGTAQDDVSH